jgi:hypothetical protein
MVDLSFLTHYIRSFALGTDAAAEKMDYFDYNGIFLKLQEKSTPHPLYPSGSINNFPPVGQTKGEVIL